MFRAIPDYLGKAILIAEAFQKWSPPKRKLARRKLSWEFLQQQAESVTFVRDNVYWSVSTSDVVGRLLFLNGYYLPENFDGVLSWLQVHCPNWSGRKALLNVGANVGATCVPLALRTKKKCIACEPVPGTFQMLQRNVQLNGLEEQIDCHQVAIASAKGRLEMVVSRDSGQSEVRTATGRQGQGFLCRHQHPEVVQVECMPLDELVPNIGLAPPDIALVWSDTQGFETDVIESGTSLWKAGVPLWVEVWPDGLDAHGGADRFAASCKKFFREVVLEEQFTRTANIAPQPVDIIAKLIRDLSDRKKYRRPETDILLLP
jgi:FkbM family methyltransferase